MTAILRPTLSETFLARIQESGETVGFLTRDNKQSWQKTTFNEFYTLARDRAYGLMALGLAPGETVLLLSRTSLNWALFDIAIMGARAISVPLSPSLNSGEMSEIAAHSGAKILIVENKALFDKIEPSVQKTLSHVLFLDTPESIAPFLEKGYQTRTQLPAQFADNLKGTKPSDTLTICYTSGTSGSPKGVMLTHDNFMSVMEDCVQTLVPAFNRSPSDVKQEVALSFLPFSHIFGRIEAMATFVFGWKQAYSQGPEHLLDEIKETEPTVLFAVPRVFEKAWQIFQQDLECRPKWIQDLIQWGIKQGGLYYGAVHNRRLPPLGPTAKYLLARKILFSIFTYRFGDKLKFSVCGGAPLPPDVGAMAQILGLRVLEGYGLTETCGPVCLNVPGQTRFGSVGKPLPEVTLKIADDGEILVQSRKVFAGYFKDETETSRVKQGNWFHTGDIGHIDSDGFLKITDRKKDLVVTSTGRSVLPQKIESLIRKHPWVVQAVVHGNSRPYLTAILTLDAAQIVEFAKKQGLLFSQYAELIKSAAIIHPLQTHLDEVNRNLPRTEIIRKFLILPQEFSVDGGELTPSFQLRRAIIDSKYQSLLNTLY